MQKTNSTNGKENKRRLVDQVASSHYLSKSVRLREMFVYVCDQVLEHAVDEIHEQEVGRQVFGRPADYDTSADNTVRVHASMLRKRIDQYFSVEGSTEPVIIEIPRGNYAPVFRERQVQASSPAETLPTAPAVEAAPALPPPVPNRWPLWLAAASTLLFAALALFFYLNPRAPRAHAASGAPQPTVNQFWTQLMPSGKQTDVVIGDASLGIFAEMTTHQPVALSEYFDRSYISKVSDRASAAKVDPAFAAQLILKRQTSYSEVSLLGRFADLAHAIGSDTKVRFARDYSFRELKSDNAIVLGYRTSNPWIEPFESHLTLHWSYDPVHGNYYPIDTTAPDPAKYGMTAPRDQPHDGYATISYLPNLSNTGNVLIISGTGGSAFTAALDFLQDEHAMAQLHTQLMQDKKASFPYFEALLKVGSRTTLPRDSSVLLVRPVKS